MTFSNIYDTLLDMPFDYGDYGFGRTCSNAVSCSKNKSGISLTVNNKTYHGDTVDECFAKYEADINMTKNRQPIIFTDINGNRFSIKSVKFSDPATIVFWTDNTKTVVKAHSEDDFDKEKGLAMAIIKKIAGNNSSYYERIFENNVNSK